MMMEKMLVMIWMEELILQIWLIIKMMMTILRTLQILVTDKMQLKRITNKTK
jgi:hypothetical protein